MRKLDRWYLRKMVEQCNLSMQVNTNATDRTSVEATIRLQGTGVGAAVRRTVLFLGMRSAIFLVVQMLYDDSQVGQGCA